MIYLIDTNIISELMKKNPDSHVLTWFSGLEEITISAVTVDEVFFGLSRREMPKKLAWFQSFIREKSLVLPVTESVARRSGEKRSALEKSGHPSTMADSLIAATASEHGLILATRNIKDFQHAGVALFNPFDS